MLPLTPPPHEEKGARATPVGAMIAPIRGQERGMGKKLRDDLEGGGVSVCSLWPIPCGSAVGTATANMIHRQAGGGRQETGSWRETNAITDFAAPSAPNHVHRWFLMNRPENEDDPGTGLGRGMTKAGGGWDWGMCAMHWDSGCSEQS